MVACNTFVEKTESARTGSVMQDYLSHQDRQRLNRQCLQREAAAGGYSQDNLFHTLLGMMDVKTKVYDPKLDIFSQCQQ